jgi:hypothetical protein
MKLATTLILAAAVGIATAGCSDDKRVNPGMGSSTSSSRVPDNTAAPSPNAQPATPSDSSVPSYTPAPSTPTPSSDLNSGAESQK